MPAYGNVKHIGPHRHDRNFYFGKSHEILSLLSATITNLEEICSSDYALHLEALSSAAYFADYHLSIYSFPIAIGNTCIDGIHAIVSPPGMVSFRHMNYPHLTLPILTSI